MSIIKATATITDACFAWLAANPQLSTHSRTGYRGEIDRLGQYVSAKFGFLTVGELRPLHWESYLHAMAKSRKPVHTRRSDVLKASSVMQAMRITRQFLIWCAGNGLLNWWPTRVNFPTPTPKAQTRTPGREPEDLPQALRLALAGEWQTAGTPQELRAVLAMNLAYWGALDVGELAALKVLNMVQRKKSALLVVKAREVNLPGHVLELWERYRNVREVELGARLPPEAALLASLETQRPLRTWSVWAMVKKWQEDLDIQPAFSPRMLRAVFVRSAQNSEAAGLAATVAHAGIVLARVAAATGDISAQIRRIQRDELLRLAA